MRHHGAIPHASENSNLESRLTLNGFEPQSNFTITYVNTLIAFLKTISETDVHNNSECLIRFNAIKKAPQNLRSFKYIGIVF